MVRIVAIGGGRDQVVGDVEAAVDSSRSLGGKFSHFFLRASKISGEASQLGARTTLPVAAWVRGHVLPERDLLRVLNLVGDSALPNLSRRGT